MQHLPLICTKNALPATKKINNTAGTSQDRCEGLDKKATISSGFSYFS